MANTARLLAEFEEIYTYLEARKEFDIIPVQLAATQANLQQARADFIRRRASVFDAQDRLLAMSDWLPVACRIDCHPVCDVPRWAARQMWNLPGTVRLPGGIVFASSPLSWSEPAGKPGRDERMARDTDGWASGAVQINGLLAVGNAEGRDEWAPLAGEKVCKDRAGRWRSEHSFDKDGGCIFCPARTRT